MLDLQVAMKPIRVLFVVIAIVLAGLISGSQSLSTPEIIQPDAGAAILGMVNITGITAYPGFVSAEIDFGYMDDLTDTWFLLGQVLETAEEATLIVWDTTTIPDGNYRLRLRVFLSDGQVVQDVVEGIRVRNYSVIETSTPAPAMDESETAVTPLPTVTPTQKPTALRQTATMLPPNPAEIPFDSWVSSLKTGSVVAVLVLVGIGLILAVRSRLRRR